MLEIATNRLSMHKLLLICLICLTSVLSVPGQEKTYNSAEELQRDVTFLLLAKNINDVTRRLDQERPSTVASLLRRLVIYSRAGQSSRVRATLEQLPRVPNWQCPDDHYLRSLIKHLTGDNVDAQRLYYERLCPNDNDGAEAFIRLWSNNGDLKAIDAWLAERSDRNDQWLMERISLRAKSGTAGPILDALAAEVRVNPSDMTRLDRYLIANNRAANLQDLSWLADTLDLRTAAENFHLGDRILVFSPEAAVKLLRKSLELPFTDADTRLIADLINRFRSMPPSIKINREKQLRYWTKRSLARAYQQMDQSLLAQPLVEELVSIKGDDILREDVHQLAGQVQGGSGQRVVETKILGDETAQRLTAEYWLERARYYDGREEYEHERDSYRQALAALSVKPEDRTALSERFQVVRSFAFFLSRWRNQKEDKPELEKLFTAELSSTPPQTDYSFQIAKLMVNNDLELDALRNSLLAKQPSFFARLFEARPEWGNDEEYLIQAVAGPEEVPSDVKDKIWSSLEPLARDPGSARAYHLAEAMNRSDEWRRAIPLYRGYLEHADPTHWKGYKEDAMKDLLTAYCQTREWRAAERFLFAQQDALWRTLPNALAEVAIAAAQENAVDDAMRLWKLSMNIDRRNLEPLSQLARTKIKPQLVALYSKMKTDDPLSTIPDQALRLLR